MSFLEILFIVGIIAVLITWGWFVILGFRANLAWGVSIIFLSPVTPFMFASRFARKARKAIYYYTISLLFLSLIAGYIQFATVDFYTLFFKKFIPDEPVIVLPEKKPEVETPQEIEVEIIEEPEIEEPVEVVPESAEVKPEKPKKRSYKVVNMQDMRLYIGKRVIVSTSTKKHKGKLLKATSSELVVRKRMSGGSTSMPIKKNKIRKVEVYL